MTFDLHANLAKKDLVVDLPLCRVLLENEVHYPWLLLVPRRNGMSKIMDLNIEDQGQLLGEMDLAQRVLWELFAPTQVNVAAIGNKTPQLHVHVIARRSDDPAWPHTVWDHPTRLPYALNAKHEMISRLQSSFTRPSFT